MTVAARYDYLLDATPIARLPDLGGTPAPRRCPLCHDAVATPEGVAYLVRDVITLRDARDTVIYNCGAGYVVGRTDHAADPGLGHLSMHYDRLHPRQFLALFCSYYQDRLGSFDVHRLPGMDWATIGRLWRDDDDPLSVTSLPSYTWSLHPFTLWLADIGVAPPEVCPACSERQLSPQEIAMAESGLPRATIRYGCGAGYLREGKDGTWQQWGQCRQPRPLAILGLSTYWTSWDDEPHAQRARDAVLATWLRRAAQRW